MMMHEFRAGGAGQMGKSWLGRFCGRILVPFLAAACVSDAAAENNERGFWCFVIVKSNNFRQDPDGELTLLNYHFFSEIFAKSPGQVRSASLQRLDGSPMTIEYVDRGESHPTESIPVRRSRCGGADTRMAGLIRGTLSTT